MIGAVAASAQVSSPAPEAALQEIAGQVQASELRGTIETLVRFGTRHTLSDPTLPQRGIGAARAWTKTRFEALSADCGGCLILETPQDTVTGKRVPNPTVVRDVLAIQRGTGDPARVIIVSGHIDSRVNDVMDAASDAPGANDDASGVAVVLECARVLSRHRYAATIVYAVLSGEEQGLLGGKILADWATAKGWRVEAVLNNDIVGNTHGMDGRVVDHEVRVFSEGTRADETPALAEARRLRGGELDSPSRNLARYAAAIATEALPDLRVRQIMRADRFSRGGDQAPMQAAGFPAVRITEADEDYTRQHQSVRQENGVAYGDVIAGVDFPYLARVARLNALTIAALASAPPPPTDVKIAGDVSPDTQVTWASVPAAASYGVWWRETTDAQWTHRRDAGAAQSLSLKGVDIDDFFFGVSARSADGFESPVEFPGPVGAFQAQRPPG